MSERLDLDIPTTEYVIAWMRQQESLNQQQLECNQQLLQCTKQQHQMNRTLYALVSLLACYSLGLTVALIYLFLR